MSRWAFSQLAIGSLYEMVVGARGLIVLALSISLGDLVSQLTSGPWIGAPAQAIPI